MARSSTLLFTGGFFALVIILTAVPHTAFAILQPPRLTISANANTIVAGGTSNINWTALTANGGNGGTITCTSNFFSGSQPDGGSVPVSPGPGSYTYTITCAGDGYTNRQASASLTVNAGCAANMGQTCTSTTANVCGTYSTNGTYQCDGSCSSTPVNPPGYGGACSSTPNSCGTTGSGVITCTGCSAIQPADPPLNYYWKSSGGPLCTGSTYACGGYQNCQNYDVSTGCSAGNAGASFTCINGDVDYQGQHNTTTYTCSAPPVCTAPPTPCTASSACGTSNGFLVNGVCDAIAPVCAVNQPPNPPTIQGVYDSASNFYGGTAPANNASGYTYYTTNSVDPEGDQIRSIMYVYDNQTSQYLTSGQITNWYPSGQWGGIVGQLANKPAGTYLIGAYTEDTNGNWSTFSGWTTITLTNPPPTAAISLSHTPIGGLGSGYPYQVGWSSTNASSCNVSYRYYGGPYTDAVPSWINTGWGSGTSGNNGDWTNSVPIQYRVVCTGGAGTATAYATQDAIAVTNISISGTGNVLPDGTTPYVITLTGSDPTGGANIGQEEFWINGSGTPNAPAYRGYFTRSADPAWTWQPSTGSAPYINCAGGGVGQKYGANTDYANGLGAPYINLLSCTTSASGNTRTTSWTVSFNPAFTTPIINNVIDGSITDISAQPYVFTPWTPFGNFGLLLPTPTCSTFTASSPVNLGQNTTLNWNCQNSTSCTEVGNSDGFATGGAVSGTDSATPTQSNNGYGLSCTGPGGTPPPFTSNPVTVVQPGATITANPVRVPTGANSTISWSSTNVTSCVEKGPGINANTKTNAGVSVPITGQSVYTINCIAPTGPPVGATTTVNVNGSTKVF